MPEARATLRLAVHQTAPLLGEVEENERELRKRVEGSAGADLLAFPELSLTGYGLRSRVQRFARPLGEEAPLTLPHGAPPLALGLPERGGDELVYNAALLLHQNRILAKHRKVYLPTYGLFDEARYFAAGSAPPPVAVLPSGWRAGLLVCEDFWHPTTLYLVAVQGADLVLVLAAAPGRGDPPEGPSIRVQDGSKGGSSAPSRELPLFSSTESWELLARTAALQYGIYLVLVNRAGVEEGLTFAGGSTVVDPTGRILARAPQAEAATLEVELTRKALRGARNPYAHLRDEDPDYLARSLAVLRDREGRER